jgi:hypothetical protein
LIMRIVSFYLVSFLVFLSLTGYAAGQITVGGDIGYFKVESSPGDSQVIFDGIYYGNTPVIIPVSVTGTPLHTLTVSKSGYFPLTRTYTSNPKAGETITVLAVLEPSTTSGSLVVTSSPRGALITIDGGMGQQAPWTYPDIRAGSHIVRAFLSGYQPYLTIVNVPPGGTVTVDATLSPLSDVGVLQVKSSPGGADVYVDGFYSGSTATTVGNLAAGQHILQLRLAGYRDWIGNVKVPPNGVTVIDATLEMATADTTGNIVVSSDPFGASVYLDSNYQGQTQADNTLDLTGIQPGSHILELQLTNYQDFMTTVDIQSGGTIPVSAELVPATIVSEIGTVQITSDPQGANIFLDNIYQGITPLTISSLNAGTHTLVLRLPGYNDYSSLVTITPGQSLQVQAALYPVATQTGSGLLIGIGAVLIVLLILRERKGNIPF